MHRRQRRTKCIRPYPEVYPKNIAKFDKESWQQFIPDFESFLPRLPSDLSHNMAWQELYCSCTEETSAASSCHVRGKDMKVLKQVLCEREGVATPTTGPGSAPLFRLPNIALHRITSFLLGDDPECITKPLLKRGCSISFHLNLAFQRTMAIGGLRAASKTCCMIVDQHPAMWIGMPHLPVLPRHGQSICVPGYDKPFHRANRSFFPKIVLHSRQLGAQIMCMLSIYDRTTGLPLSFTDKNRQVHHLTHMHIRLPYYNATSPACQPWTSLKHDRSKVSTVSVSRERRNLILLFLQTLQPDEPDPECIAALADFDSLLMFMAIRTFLRSENPIEHWSAINRVRRRLIRKKWWNNIN